MSALNSSSSPCSHNTCALARLHASIFCCPSCSNGTPSSVHISTVESLSRVWPTRPDLYRRNTPVCRLFRASNYQLANTMSPKHAPRRLSRAPATTDSPTFCTKLFSHDYILGSCIVVVVVVDRLPSFVTSFEPCSPTILLESLCCHVCEVGRMNETPANVHKVILSVGASHSGIRKRFGYARNINCC